MSNLYYMDVYDKDFSTKLARIRSFVSLRWEDRLNSVTRATIELDKDLLNLTHTKIRPYNRVLIKQEDDKVWRGYIVKYTVDDQKVTVECRNMLGFLKKRVIHAEYNQALSTTAKAILTAINAVDDTTIAEGTIDLTGSGAFNFQNQKVQTALLQIIKTAGAEMEIDVDGNLNVRDAIGTDLSATIKLRYNEARFEETNSARVQVVVDGDELANRLHGSGKDEAGSVIRNDGDSQDLYGVVEGVGTYDASDATTLQNQVDEDLDIKATLAQLPRMNPIDSRVPRTSFDVGDTISVRVKIGFYDLEAGYKVTRKSYRVAMDGQSITTTVQVSKKPVFVKDLLGEIAGIETRLYNTEQLTS